VGYTEITYYAGETIEKRKYYAKRSDAPKEKRENQEKPSKEEIERINWRNAERTLRLSLNTNFVDGDYNITMTYGTDAPPPTWDEAKRDWKRALRRMRKLYAEAGIEFKWICVTAIGKKHGRLHHHLVCSAGIHLGDIQKAWGLGKVRAGTLDTNGQYGGLANYLLNQKRATPGEGERVQRWSCSRNLEPPRVERRTVKARSWREDITPPPGYYEDANARHIGVDKFGRPTIEYRFLRIAPPKKQKRKRE